MKKIVILGFMFLLSVPFASSSSMPYKVVCYLSSWAYYRSGDGVFVVEDIDPALCTHLIYAFAVLTDNQIAPRDPHLDLEENYGLGAYDRFNNLRKSNPGLKTLIAVGGWAEGSGKYSRMASDPDSRKTFVDSCVEFLSKHKFDGLDLQWLYPANRGGRPQDKANFALLIKELSEAFQTQGFLLTASVSPNQRIIDSAYHIPTLVEYLDFINLMTYDFHGGWDKITGHNAPLNYSVKEPKANRKLNVDYAVRYWLSKGFPSENLILGMPFFGRGFRLLDPEKHGLGAPASGAGINGDGMMDGMVAYYEICKWLDTDDEWNIVFDRDIQAPYAVKDTEWLGYDDPKSIAIKVRYLKQMKLGGGMVWSVDADDFFGNCGGQKYPLLRAVNDALNNETVLPPDQPEQGVSEAPENDQESSTDVDISITTEIGQKSSPDSDVSTGTGMIASPNNSSESKTYKVVCYFSSWAYYRNGEGMFVIEDIDPALCTHLIYSFATLSGNEITVANPHLDLKEDHGVGGYDRFNNLRKSNPGLKTLIAIGGWAAGSGKFSRMASDPDSRKTFVDSCVEFLSEHKFDGLDLQWLYPANRGGRPEDKGNFALLVKELREAFQTHGFLLTASVSPIQRTIDSAYDVPTLAEHLDFINLMTYDFHGWWDRITGHNAPLNYSATEPKANQKRNVNYAVKYWLSKGAPSEKLILGMPSFGRSFRLKDPENHGLGARTVGRGMTGDGMTDGMLAYHEICDMLENDDEWTIVFNYDIQAPYAVKDTEWIGYDDPKSIAIKVRYLKKMNLGGGMVWSLDTDDFRGNCDGQKYPLLQAVNDELNDGTVLSPDQPEQGVSVAPENDQESSAHVDISTTAEIDQKSSPDLDISTGTEPTAAPQST